MAAVVYWFSIEGCGPSGPGSNPGRGPSKQKKRLVKKKLFNKSFSVINMVFKTPKGMRDFLPEIAEKKRFIEKTICNVFELYGFKPMQTPIIESLKVLTLKGSGGREIEKEIYCFKDKKGRKLGLRFDLTVPLARIMALNKNLKKPFKRYESGTVYRYDKPQTSRYREFTQADADIAGSDSVLADFEIVSLSYKIIKKLGLKAKMHVNSRELLESFALKIGVHKKKVKECFRVLDKLDKIGRKKVAQELKEKKITTKILEITKINSFTELEKQAKKIGVEKQKFLGLKKLFELAKKNNIKSFLKLDLTLARGLEYYTGIVFEIKTGKGPSIAAGGRYDDLVKAFGGQKMPSIGISFGVDRILDLMEEEMVLENKTKIYLFSVKPEYNEKIVEVSEKLRNNKIGVEIDLNEKPISKNLEYANKQKILFAGLIGEREAKKNCLTIKNMKTGKQKSYNLKNLEKIIKALKK